MITTINLVNIHHHTVTLFFLIIRIFKIFSLSNLKIYNRVLLTIITMLYIISPGPHLFYNWMFVLFDPLHSFHPPHPLNPFSGKHLSAL